MMNLKVNRKYKERLFLRVFRDRKDLLSLYNAVNGTSYTDPEQLEITTIEGVIYMGIKNDVSFMIDNVLNLWEHQSSYNPNMPIRGLSYFSRLYQKYIERHGINIYSSSLKELPDARYIVFYNGRKEEPDRTELRLSDAFMRRRMAALENRENREPGNQESCLEVKAIMLNINYGKNRELMEQCQKLKEYAQFIAQIRDRQDAGVPVEEAVEEAIDYCIGQEILKDILSEHRAEVIAVFLTEYDAQAHMEMEREEWTEKGREEGLKEGLKEGRQIQLVNQIRKKLARSMSEEDIAEMLEADIDEVRTIGRLIRENPDWDDLRICREFQNAGSEV